MTVLRISQDYLTSLVEDGKRSLKRRQHKNIHSSYEDPCQRLLNAIGVDSYIRPHRHSLDPKSEMLVAVKGLFALVTFDDAGEICEIIKFGTEKYNTVPGLSVGVDLPPLIWHTVVALDPDCVLLELKAGPFDPTVAKEPAPWAPEEQTLEGRAFLACIRASLDARTVSCSADRLKALGAK